MKNFILDGVKEKSIIATVVIDHIEDAMPLAETLFGSGISSIEITLRTACALKAIKTIARGFPEMLVGAGTVLTRDQVFEIQEAGAKFAVAPGLTPEVVDAAREIGLAFAPGICTPSEIERAIALGCRILKFFPAEGSGGITYLKSIAAPYSHLGVRFIPLGGIDERNFIAYLQQDSVAAVGGSWLAPRKTISEKKWNDIHRNCMMAEMKLADNKIGDSVNKNVDNKPLTEQRDTSCLKVSSKLFENLHNFSR